MIASPPGTLKPSDWVILNCSFSRPDRPVSVHWFQGQSRVPVHNSPRHYLAESFLLLPQVSPLDSGTWGCVLTYRDGFNVSITYNLKVQGNSSKQSLLLTTTFLFSTTPDSWVPKTVCQLCAVSRQITLSLCLSVQTIFSLGIF